MAAEPEPEPATENGARWRRLYALVLAVLAVEIVVLFAVTRAFP